MVVYYFGHDAAEQEHIIANTIAGGMSINDIGLHFGHALVMVEKWDAQGMLAAIDRYKVTTSHMVPTQFARLLKLPDEIKARCAVSSTRHMIHAAAPCPPDISAQ